MGSPLRKPDAINWNAASVELPEIPMLPPGQDAMSATISAVLPTLAAELAANVAALSAKENTFSGKVGAAQVAYQNGDDAGSQSVGQIVGMLGQLGQQAGQMSQSAGGPMQALGGQTGMFGSLMQQAMQGAKGGGGQSGGGQGGAMPGGGGAPAPMGTAGPQSAPGQPPAAGQPPRDDAQVGAESSSEREREQREERGRLQRADESMPGAAGPERNDSGPAPVSPTRPRDGAEDTARNL